MERRKPSEIQDKLSESSIIATLFVHPNFLYHNDTLKYTHFFDELNSCLFYAIDDCLTKDINNVSDPLNIIKSIENSKFPEKIKSQVTVDLLRDIVDLGSELARESIDEYNELARIVVDKSLRRDLVKKIYSIENACFNDELTDAQSFAYEAIEEILCNYQSNQDIKPMAYEIDDIWDNIENRNDDDFFIDFQFPTLNEFCKISKTDCITFAAKPKVGKSMMLMNCLHHLLAKGKKVIYIDTELGTELFIMRLISHMTKIKFKIIRDKKYNEEQRIMIRKAIEWIKGTNFMHRYMPVVEDDKILGIVKAYKNKFGCDVVILDYLKGNGDHALDAYKNSASLGKTMDLMKNVIAGKENLAVLTAVQLNNDGTVAKSADIKRNCSSLIILEPKTLKEIHNDGGNKYGNIKMIVTANRNGMQHVEGEYINLLFDGDRCTMGEALQSEIGLPY